MVIKQIFYCDLCDDETVKSGSIKIDVMLPDNKIATKNYDLCSTCLHELSEYITEKKK